MISLPKLAVLILTYNEEANISECVRSAAFADEIVVIDSGSNDRTVEVAESLGARCVCRAMKDGFAAQRNFALTQTDADWVLFLDADERITPELAAEIQTVIQQGGENGYEILRINILFGKTVYHGGFSPDYSLRLYPRHAISWQGAVHEQALVTVPLQRLRCHMLHYTYTTWDRYFVKFNQYTTLMARQMHEKGKRAHFFPDILVRPLVAFFKVYVLKRGFLDGRLGLVLALLHHSYTMVKYIKLYWLQKQKGA